MGPAKADRLSASNRSNRFAGLWLTPLSGISPSRGLAAQSRVLETMLNRPRTATVTVVFDLDGTIADTAGDLIDAANAALIGEGFGEAPPEAIRRGVGYGTKAMLQSALAAQGHEASAERMQRMSAGLVAHYEKNLAAKTRLFPGFSEVSRPPP